MFDLRELKLMFLDPTDLIVNNLNRLLSNNKTIQFIFLETIPIFSCCKDSFFVLIFLSSSDSLLVLTA